MTDITLDRNIFAGISYLVSGNIERDFYYLNPDPSFYSNLKEDCENDIMYTFIPNKFISNISMLNTKALLTDTSEKENNLFRRYLYEDENMSFSIKLKEDDEIAILNDGFLVTDIQLILEKHSNSKEVTTRNYLIDIFKLNELRYIEPDYIKNPKYFDTCKIKLSTINYPKTSNYVQELPKLNLNKV